MRSVIRAVLGGAALLAMSQPAFSQAAAPGQILFTEAAGNSVVDIRPGGDLTGAPRFATGFSLPSAICVGPGADVYVAEFGSGEVTVITAGGDFALAPAFATGLSSPNQLVCDATQVLVAENGSGEVTDITLGGDFTGAPAFAFGFGSLSALFRDSGGTLWAFDSTAGSRIIDITAGGDFTGAPGFAMGTFVPGLSERGGALLASGYLLGSIIDWTAGGDLGLLPRPVDVSFPIGILDVGALGLFVATSGPDLYEVSAGGDFTGGPVYATGAQVFPWWNGLVYVPGCGSGLVEGTEECDDGNTLDGDGCDMNCIVEVCGNGTLQVGEECDDGNTTDGDGCDMSCVVEVCGNGALQSGEECDDGNTVDGDGCDASCVVELCGNGVLQMGSGEECDDGNTVEFDGCSASCLLEFCGDGVTQPSEGCDDGNVIDGDGCDAMCIAEVCGNLVVQMAAGETCDDGNNLDEDGCSGVCELEFCGDGVVQAGLGELCDDGNTVDGDGCSAICDAITYCGATPATACFPAARASLSIHEKKAGNEKLKVRLDKVEATTTVADFGDPATGSSIYEICIYDDGDTLVAALAVDRAGDTCESNPCWKTTRNGFEYKDREKTSDGVKTITTRAGEAGKGKVTVKARNRTNKGQFAMPTGITAALEGAAAATVQVVTSDAECVAATLTTVKKTDATQFKANAP